MKFKYFLIAGLYLSGLFYLGNISKVSAAELSTGFHSVSSIENYEPSDGWSGNPDEIKTNDDISFTNSYVGGNTTFLRTHIDFPTIPPNSIIKRLNFKLRGKHQDQNWIGASSISTRKTCASGYQNIITNVLPLFTYYFTQTFSSISESGLTVEDINNRTACFIPEIFTAPGEVVYYDYFEAEVVYELVEPTATPTQTPSPTAAPTPTAVPTPAPFLELPFDYKGKGKSFEQVALDPESWFDHRYPLQNVVCCTFLVTKYDFSGKDAEDAYRSHSGYDYASRNGVVLGTPVLAAAEGMASFTPEAKSFGSGNVIKIDHGNGYRTIYEHLSLKNLIVSAEGVKVHVNKGQKIGEVGMTGITFGPHIHFSVMKNETESQDSMIDLVDPLGWEGRDNDGKNIIDPWTLYTMNGKHGPTSYSLFIDKSKPVNPIIPTSGGEVDLKEVNVKIPSNAYPTFFTMSANTSSFVSQTNLQSVMPSLYLYALNSLGDAVHNFLSPIQILYSYAAADLQNIKEDTLKLYYFNPQTDIWEALASSVDMQNKTVSASTDHFSHFALMGEQKDTIAPTTNVVLQGERGQGNWYRSAVTIKLNGTDNHDGLGLLYTLYAVDGSEWAEYSKPVVIDSVGEHTISYQSFDKANNKEQQKRVIFTIDKTPPEALIQYDLGKFDVVVSGKDDNGAVGVTVENGSGLNPKYTVMDRAGNKLVINTGELQIGKQVTQTIKSLQYNTEPAVALDRNIFFTLVLIGKNDVISQLDQYVSMKGEQKIFTTYSSQTKATKVSSKSVGNTYKTETKPGIVLLHLETQNGQVKYSY